MKIVMHCVYFPPEVGGLESHVYYLCRALAKRGHEVHIVTSRSIPDTAPSEVVEGIHVHRTWFPSRNPIGWVAHALASAPATARVAKGADIIHAQAFSSVVPCRHAGGGRQFPLVATYHTSHFLRRADRPVWKPILASLVQAANYNLAASREIAEVGERLAPGSSVEALTNGVETDVFQPIRSGPAAERADEIWESAEPRIVVPRRLFEKNGVEYALRALPTILESVPRARMVLIGDGPERGRLEALAEALKVTGSLCFLGARPNHEMPALISSADLAVFPSLMEATSVAALECMACELPVVATRVGGLPEIVDEDVGALVTPRDPTEIARAVVQIVQSGSAPTLGERARHRVVEKWSNRRLAERHEEIYAGLRERWNQEKAAGKGIP